MKISDGETTLNRKTEEYVEQKVFFRRKISFSTTKKNWFKRISYGSIVRRWLFIVSTTTRAESWSKKKNSKEKLELRIKFVFLISSWSLSSLFHHRCNFFGKHILLTLLFSPSTLSLGSSSRDQTLFC